MISQEKYKSWKHPVIFMIQKIPINEISDNGWEKHALLNHRQWFIRKPIKTTTKQVMKRDGIKQYTKSLSQNMLISLSDLVLNEVIVGVKPWRVVVVVLKALAWRIFTIILPSFATLISQPAWAAVEIHVPNHWSIRNVIGYHFGRVRCMWNIWGPVWHLLSIWERFIQHRSVSNGPVWNRWCRNSLFGYIEKIIEIDIFKTMVENFS